MSQVACRNFKISRVGVLSRLHNTVGNLATFGFVSRLSLFRLSAVATFWPMSLVGIYPGRASMWLGKLVKRSDKPLGIKWIKDPVKILGIVFSYDSSGNNLHNFDLKIQKLQTNLDIWCSRDLTIFGRVLIIKAMGVSSLIHSASNIDVPKEIIGNVQSRNQTLPNFTSFSKIYLGINW